MRILHSSDWHLGQHFMGRSRQAEHQALIGWLLEQVRELKVDLVLIAGDLFDTGTPPSYARSLFNQLVIGLQAQQCQLLALGGNHDSVTTLSEGVELFREFGADIRPSATVAADTIYVASDQSEQPAAIIIACPYLRPRDLLISAAGQSADEKRSLLQQAMQQFFAEAYEAAQALRKQLNNEQLPILLSAHLTAVGGRLTESVRELYIGSLDAFPADAFPPVDYIALGHIHRSQQIKAAQPIFYSGSPIALSFDESNRCKSMQLIELLPKQPLTVTAVTIPCFQPMAVLKGNLAQIEAQLSDAIEKVTLQGEMRLWLEVCLSEDDYLSDLFPRLEALCHELPVDILRIQRQRSIRQRGVERAHSKETLVELEPGEVFNRRLEQEQLPEPRTAQLQAAFAQICAALQETDEVDG